MLKHLVSMMDFVFIIDRSLTGGDTSLRCTIKSCKCRIRTEEKLYNNRLVQIVSFHILLLLFMIYNKQKKPTYSLVSSGQTNGRGTNIFTRNLPKFLCDFIHAKATLMHTNVMHYHQCNKRGNCKLH